MVECHLAKVEAASSNLVFRSNFVYKINLYMRVSYIGNTLSFQASKVGSIPTTRSIYI